MGDTLRFPGWDSDGVIPRSARRHVISFLLAVLFLPLAAVPAFCADIAILKSDNLPPYRQAISGFLARIKATHSEYDMAGDMDKGATLARKIRKSSPKLVLAVGAKAATALVQEIDDIPIVVMMVARPERGLLQEKNVYGVYLSPSPDDQLRYLKKILPDAKRVGLILSGSSDDHTPGDISEAASRHRISVSVERVRNEMETPSALRKLKEKTDALMLVMDDAIASEQAIRHIVEFSVKNHYPIFGFSRQIVKSGALFTSVTNFEAIGKQTAELSEKIMNGDQPPDDFAAPVSTGYSLNVRVAELLGLSLPKNVIDESEEKHE